MSLASRVASRWMVRIAILTQRQHEGRKEWALISKGSGKVLKWFGTSKPSEEAVAKEEKRIQFFKHKSAAAQDVSSYYQLVVDITEGATKHKYPVVRHIFVGKTRKEAQGYYDSHMKTDEFMRDCVKDDKWKDVECKHTLSWIEPKKP